MSDHDEDELFADDMGLRPWMLWVVVSVLALFGATLIVLVLGS